MINRPTTFYSASAGSGKTFTLAKDYLTYLFTNDFHNGYKGILAVTFTNKAVAEMKLRILEYLNAFTNLEIPEKIKGIYEHIASATGFTKEQMQEKALKVRNTLLHDYSSFDIVTIDAFSHRILRTFSRDMDLPDGFEIEMDTDRIIATAIDRVIARAGKDKALTKILVSFSLSKIDADRSWDIAFDLNNIAQIIRNENHYEYLQLLKLKNGDDFLRFRESVESKIKQTEKTLVNAAQQLARQAEALNLKPEEFKGSSRSTFFPVLKLASGNTEASFSEAWHRNVSNGDFYTSKTAKHIIEAIDSIAPNFIAFQTLVKNEIGNLLFHKNILKNVVPLSLLSEIIHEIELIKIEEQIVPIYEFNSLLSKQISDEPAPFIYERLGERYKNYFIDEFQDTSRMQWNNLKPLIENAIQQERLNGTRGSLMLVGDAKQSIYRWRGGDADQFVSILNSDTLFFQDIKKDPLPYNYRSLDNIVIFNNELFNIYGSYLFDHNYRQLYEDHLKQKTTNKPGGYIQIDLLPHKESRSNTDYTANNDEDSDDIDLDDYASQVLIQISHAREQGFIYGDMTVLVRSNNQGSIIANHLLEKNIQVVSGDSLLVKDSSVVQFFMCYLNMILVQHEEKIRYDFLKTYCQLFPAKDSNMVFNIYLRAPMEVLLKELLQIENHEISDTFSKYSFYDAMTKSADALRLFDFGDLRFTTFLEYAFEFSQKKKVSLRTFIDSWIQKSKNYSVAAVKNNDAVTVMTIHKSKGLEFPVVFVPYCDVKLDHSRDAKSWIPVIPEDYAGFEYVYIDLKKECLDYPEIAARQYQENMSRVEMDHINTLYVAFTRAEKQLYITSRTTNSKSQSSPSYLNILLDYIEKYNLQESLDNHIKSYSIGDKQQVTVEKSPLQEDSQNSSNLSNYNIAHNANRLQVSTRRGQLWSSGAATAIDSGNRVHEYLAQIITMGDMKKVALQIQNNHILSAAEKSKLTAQINGIITHLDFKPYFDTDYKVITERAILSPNGKTKIPDRLLIKDREAIIIDFKTGTKQDHHKNQVDGYASLLQEMDFQVIKKILMYTDSMELVTWQ